MRYHIRTWGSLPCRHYRIAGLALTMLLALALACGQEQPSAAPIVAPDTGAVDAAAAQAQAAAEAAQEAAAAAREAASAAQAASAEAEEAVRRGEDRPSIQVIGEGTASVSASASGTGTGTGSGSGTGTHSGSASLGPVRRLVQGPARVPRLGQDRRPEPPPPP